MLREPSGGDGFAARSDASNPWLPYTLVGPDPKGRYRRVGVVVEQVRSVVDGRDTTHAVCTPIPLLETKEPQRVGKLKALGNGLCIPLAVEVIKAFLDAERG